MNGEEAELRDLLSMWLVSGILRKGEVVWDPQEGFFRVTVESYSGPWTGSAAEFRTFTQGLEAGLEAARWQQ